MRLISYKPQLSPWSSFDRHATFRELLDSAQSFAGLERDWVPPLDIYEDEEKVTVNLEVAGMKKEDFEISLHDDTLTISGERKNESEAREGVSFRSERTFGRFSRSIQLSGPVKFDAATAVYDSGLLTVVLPKAEEAKPRKIAVG